MPDSLQTRLWQLSRSGEPVVMLGRQHRPDEAAAFARLLELGVLLHGERCSAWSLCPDCDCGAEERIIRWQGDVPVAICPADHRRDEVLTRDEVACFILSIVALMQETAAAIGLGPAEELASGLWRLGRLPDGRIIAAAPTQAGMVLPGLVGVLRMVDREGPIVLVGPEMPARRRAELAHQGIHTVMPADILAAANGATALGFDLAKLTDGNAGKHRLVLVSATSVVRLDGKEAVIRPRPFQLLRILVREHRRGVPLVSRHALHDEIFSAGAAETAVRSLVSELQNLLKKAFGANSVEGLIENRTGHGYLLTLPPLTTWINE